MLLKSADDRSHDIEMLESLLLHPAADDRIRKKVQRQIVALRTGMQGEKKAAYEINFHFEASEYWAMIHDLRITAGGRVAQIDHLLINRFLEIWVCESKCYGGGIAINRYGECTSFRNGRAYGIASPLEQNEKHRLALRAFFRKHRHILPSRLGFSIVPRLFSVVLVASNARISRPTEGREKYDNVFKADQIRTRILKEHARQSNPLFAARVVGSDTLRAFGENLVKFHRSHVTDWHARFGLEPAAQTAEPTGNEAAENALVAGSNRRTAGRLYCADCDVDITIGIVRYCRGNAERFAGRLLCMTCQKKYN